MTGLTAAELGTAFLGGTTLASLPAAGLVEELRAGALARATAAFRADREPFYQGLGVPGLLVTRVRESIYWGAPNHLGSRLNRSSWSSPTHATWPSGRRSTAGASNSSLTSTT